jgi:hypothetical protein
MAEVARELLVALAVQRGGAPKMFHTPVSLSEDIELVICAVTQWCAENGSDIDSAEGRRAIKAAVDIVQTYKDKAAVLRELEIKLAF